MTTRSYMHVRVDNPDDITYLTDNLQFLHFRGYTLTYVQPLLGFFAHLVNDIDGRQADLVGTQQQILLVEKLVVVRAAKKRQLERRDAQISHRVVFAIAHAVIQTHIRGLAN